MENQPVRLPLAADLKKSVFWEDEMNTSVRLPIRKRHPEKALSPAKIRNAKPGRHADGNGLYLVVDPNGAKRWVLRTVVHRKRRDIGLGGLSWVSLAEAREEAARLRKIARKGGDPIAERRQERRIVPTFEEAAREVHGEHSKGFRNEKHKQDWISSLGMYAFPALGKRPVDSIETRDILEVLTPIWNKTPETARRVKQRLRTVFDYVKAKGLRTGDNPVEGITKALPKHTRNQDHFAALPYSKLPGFLEQMHGANVSIYIKLAFEFMILTAARTNEILFAQWPEIDLEAKTWTVPAERMKMKREHRVPLSARCIEILKKAKELSMGGEYIFPGQRQGKPLSNMAFLMALRRMDRADITAHGFRSSFRDWAEEKTNTQRSVVEAALAHQVENKVEAAYLRTTLFEKRRRLMDSWAAFATMKPKEKVVKMRA
jgi:integrase